MAWPVHIPDGDPFCSCGELARKHRQPRLRHQMPSEETAAQRLRNENGDAPRKSRSGPSGKSGKKVYVRKLLTDSPIVAIDGEGQGRFPHLYTYLAAVDDSGKVMGEIRDRGGLETEACLDFFLGLLDLGVKQVFGFSIGYDLTKILTALPDKLLYLLNRPEKRGTQWKGRKMHKPVYWRTFKLHYLRGQLKVRRTRWNKQQKKYIDEGDTITIWDIFKFFQSKFTTALLDWKIAPDEKLRFMMEMKDNRAKFEEIVRMGGQKKIEEYCQEECMYLGQLVRALYNAHEHVGLTLRGFWGAGATASSLMSKLEIKKYLSKPPEEMRYALSCSFFGGRFEISRSGPIRQKVHNYDISSAYPYQTTFLPCLADGCGKWEKVSGRQLQSRIRNARLALVHTRVRLCKDSPEAWGPLPWRSHKGEIVFPRANGGVWVWRDEYEAAARIFPGVEATEAWVYENACSHQPFAKVPEYYAERVRIGKEGAGIVLKLGVNSLYGKTAQSIGQPKYQSFVWAGSITSGCRAQLLTAFESVKDPWSILMFATDGIQSTEELVMPAPRDTGTARILFEDGQPVADCRCKPASSRCKKCPPVEKPLGGWEHKEYEKGVFLLRPGIYFPLNPTAKEIKDVKARGMAKGVLLDNASRIQRQWEESGPDLPFMIHGYRDPQSVGSCEACGKQAHGHHEDGEPCTADCHPPSLQRFVGMKSGITKAEKKPAKRSETYGEWIDYPIEASFSPKPKRERFLGDFRLETFKRMTGESFPYTKAAKTFGLEVQKIREAEAIFSEQADGDFSMEDFRETSS